MSPIDEVSNRFVRAAAALSPMLAVYVGLPSDDPLDDLSPAGLDARAGLVRDTLAAAQAAPVHADAERLARDVLVERLLLDLDRFDAGDLHSSLNVIASPVQDVRQLFDLLPTGSDDDAADLARRMAAVPDALAGYRESLLEGVRRGRVSAVRQVDKCATQCDTYSGTTSGAPTGFFAGLAAGAGQSGSLGDELERAAAAADAAYAELAEFLRVDLRPHAPELDAVGEEVYARGSRDFLGATVDLQETYAWGWHEFLSIEAELKEVAGRIVSGGTPRQVADHLDGDPRYQVAGTDGLQRWMQELSDGAIDELGRTHFDIPDALRTLDCKIAPPGGGVGAYYTGPSDDLSRPGAMWWSVEQGKEVFPTWREVTTVYHEGVPGHHLQIATATYQRDSLNDYQRLLAGTSGHAEGWALYAERLVRELGYLDDDGDLLGMLDAQLFRAARVVIDIGMHLRVGDPDRHRVPRGGALDARARARVPAHPHDLRSGAQRRRDRPLPRLAGAGAVVQGRRAAVARRPRRGAGAPRRHVRLQGLPHQGAAVRRHGPRAAARPARHHLTFRPHSLARRLAPPLGRARAAAPHSGGRASQRCGGYGRASRRRQQLDAAQPLIELDRTERAQRASEVETSGSSSAARRSWWRITSDTMNRRNASVKAGSSPDCSARVRSRSICCSSRSGSAGGRPAAAL